MKKSLFFVATAAVVLASCSSDVKISENTAPVGSNAQMEIAFSTLARTPKRAISNNTNGYIAGPTFPDTCAMTITAYDVTNTRMLFDSTHFVRNGESGLWNGETHRYWPLSPVQVNFLAISQANGNDETNVTWTTDNTPKHQVVVEMSDNYPIATAQHDFMYAIGSGEVEQIGNALKFPEKVNMEFKHTQAYLVFNLKAADDASKAIKIKNVEIKGARTAGKATIARHAPGTYADEDVDLTWAAPTAGAEAAYHGGSSAYNSVTATQGTIDTALQTTPSELGHLLVVPNMSAANTFAEGGFTSFKISYELESKAYSFEYVPVSTKLEAGKKYIYDITFKLHEILVNPSVAEWEADTTRYVSVPVVSMKYDALAAVTLPNAAGIYSFAVTGFTAGQSVSVAEASDTQNIIDGLKVPSTVPTGGAVLVEVRKSATVNDKSATITLTVNGTPYEITIKTPTE